MFVWITQRKNLWFFYNFNVFTSSLYYLECRIQTRKPSILQVQYYRFCQISPNIWTEVAPVVLSKVSRNKTVKKSVKTKSARREFKFLQRIFKFIFFSFLTENKVSGKQIFTLARGGRRVRLWKEFYKPVICNIWYSVEDIQIIRMLSWSRWQ